MSYVNAVTFQQQQTQNPREYLLSSLFRIQIVTGCLSRQKPSNVSSGFQLCCKRILRFEHVETLFVQRCRFAKSNEVVDSAICAHKGAVLLLGFRVYISSCRCWRHIRVWSLLLTNCYQKKRHWFLPSGTLSVNADHSCGKINAL